MTHLVDIAAGLPLTPRQQDVGPAVSQAPTPSGCRPRWFVVATYAQAERRAHAALHLKGFEPYLPLITVRRQDRTFHTGPLFPGYLFVRLDLSRPWYPVRWCPGVFSLLAVDGIPNPCPEGVVSVLQAAERLAATRTQETDLWAPGVPCSLATGLPMGGRPAVVLSVSRTRVKIGIVFLGHVRVVSVPPDCLVKREEPA